MNLSRHSSVIFVLKFLQAAPQLDYVFLNLTWVEIRNKGKMKLAATDIWMSI